MTRRARLANRPSRPSNTEAGVARRERAQTLRAMMGIGRENIAAAEKQIEAERAELMGLVQEAYAERLLTVSEMAEWTGYSRQALHAWLRAE